MLYRTRSRLSILAAILLSAAAAYSQDEIAILQLKVVEGEGMVHQTGTRSSRPLVVQVTDETGRPVEGVAVSFRMPSSGPRGLFSSGLPSEVLISGPDGRVSVWEIRWGDTPGPARIRITAVKGDVRAGTFSEQYLSAPGTGGASGVASSKRSVSKMRGKWVLVAVAAAGAAAGGLVLGLSGKSANPTAGSGAPPAAAGTGVQVGPPTITIGTP